MGILIILCGIAIGVVLAQKGITKGVSIGGIAVSGSSEQNIDIQLADAKKKIATEKLILTCGNIKKEIPLTDIDGKVDGTALFMKAHQVGKTGTIFYRLYDIVGAAWYGKDIPISITIDKDKLHVLLDDFTEEYALPAQDARAVVRNGAVVLEPSREHLVFNETDLEENILTKMAAGDLEPMEIKASDHKEAQRHTSDLKDIDTILSVYTTEFNSSDTNRNYNIKLAYEKINHQLLLPKDLFSFNNVVGERLAEYGYLDAPVFMDGKLVPDAGGGVCQVSTTLFNSVLLAGLEIESRTPHFAPTGYIPIGRDATVADHYIDFQFTDSLAHGIYIYVEQDADSITIYILGNHSDKKKSVTLNLTDKKVVDYKTITKNDSTIKAAKEIEEGHNGYDVTVTRQVIEPDGQHWSDRIVSQYDPVDTVIKINKQFAGSNTENMATPQEN